MWNLNDIKEKKKYVIERLKSCQDEKEHEKLVLTLMTYINLLNHSGTIRYTGFYNFMDFLSGNKFTLIKDFKYKKIKKSLIHKNNEDYLDVDYLKFLINILRSISNNEEVIYSEEKKFETLKLSEDMLIQISKDFYAQLGDVEIKKKANQILSDRSSLNFTTRQMRSCESCAGLAFEDHIFQKPYLTIRKFNTINDSRILTHEVMHGIDFYFDNKIFSENYYGFHEVPTYTIEYLFLDYLKELGFNSSEIFDLQMEKEQYIVVLAILTLYEIKRLSIQKYGVLGWNLDRVNIKEIISNNILKNLLEVESAVIAYGLYKQIKEDKKKGLFNLKEFMKTKLPKDKRPDFSFIGLDDSRILKLVEEIGKSQIIEGKNSKK